MQALIFNGPYNLNLVEHEIRSLGENDLLVKVGACGVCGTDFHIFKGEAPAKSPVVIGHEYTGEVAGTGRSIKSFNAGDRVAVNPNIHCGYCRFCRSGKINLCENLKALGVTLDGGIANYSVVPASQAHLLPAEFPFDIAAFAEPLSCCIHGINQADIKLNDSVIIVGAGTIGLMMMQLVIQRGSSKVIVVDISEEKLSLAKKLNADHVFNTGEESSLKNITDLTAGGADVVIECAGNSSAVNISFSLVKKGGTIVIFGLAEPKDFYPLYLQSFFHKELTLKSSLLNPNTFQAAVDMLVNSKIKVDLFSTNKIRLEEDPIKELFGGQRNRSIVKHMIIPN